MEPGSNPSSADVEKRAAAARAAQLVEDGMVVGLGSGSTAEYAIEALGQRIRTEKLGITGVATSYQASEAARYAGIPQSPLWTVGEVDLVIDGADQVAGFNLIKGGGGAHVKEKIVAAMGNSVTIIVDSSKDVDVLDLPIPIEVVPDAQLSVQKRLTELGGEVQTRTSTGKLGPVISDNGNIILDADFGAIEEPHTIGSEISVIPGVVDHGLFVAVAERVIIGTDSETIVRQE